MPAKRKPELLAPIKNLAGLEACKRYADAVYFSVDSLSMREKCKDINLRNLEKIVSEIHESGLKAYLTLNAVIHNKDIAKMKKIISKAKYAKVDAVIAWDPAAISEIKKAGLVLHISTQANVSNIESAKFYEKQGAKRIILAREMSLDEIRQIKKKTGVEIECFIHGAMCVSISGRCYLSSYLYGKSANCGACIQPCRKLWTLKDEEKNEIICDGRYLLSAKDLCMIGHIPELINSGIDSFKIEGRLRDSRYVGVVSKCYREAIDSVFDKTFTKGKAEIWKGELSKVYNRGFSEGFYFGIPTDKGFNYDNSDNMSSEVKTQIGRVLKFYKKPMACIARLESGELKVGDKICIEGENTYIVQTVKSLKLNDKDTECISPGDIAGIKLDKAARENDILFRITERDKANNRRR